jgi:AAT family amino acid transporter
MTTTVYAGESTGTAPARPRPWFVTGLLSLGVVVGLSLGSWYLLVDPKWSPLHTYPFPTNAVLFWAILSVVFVGFNLEFWGFDRLTQPVKGLAIVAVVLALAFGITALLAAGLGHFDPRFSADRKGGTGYFAGALFVLFGFFTFVTVVVNWEHWPWTQMGVSQPKVGLFEIAVMLAPTLLLYLVLGLPTMAISASAGHSILALDTLIGWFYSVIVSMLVTALVMENWPWRLAGPGWRTAAASTMGNFVAGTALYFVLLGLAKALIGSKTVDLLGVGINIFPAQIGVCWVFWMIYWSNACANVPNTPSAAKNYAVRIVITLLLGIGTFLIYYHMIAGTVLHEPVVAGDLYGNALGFIDWAVLWTLFYVVCFESYGLRQPAAADTTELPAPARELSGRRAEVEVRTLR